MERQHSRPILIGLYRAVRLDADRVEVCNAGRSVVLTAPGKAETLGALLDSLDGTATLDELTERFPGLAVRSLVASLDARGLLTQAGASAAGGGDLRTAMALDERASLEGSRRLHDSTVVLAGCGPLSATAAVAIAKAGAGRLVLADAHLVTDNDVIACPVIGRDAAGRARHDVVAQACAEAGAAQIERGADAAAAALDGATVAIIEARYEEAGMLATFADDALRAGVAHVVHWQDGLELAVSPLLVRGGRPCHRCMESRRLSHVAHIDEHMAYLAHRHRVAAEPDSYLAAHTSVAAGLLAVRVLRHLAGTLPQTERSTAIVVDLATCEWHREAVLAVPGCTGCAAVAPA